MDVLQNAAKTHNPEGGGKIIPIGPCDVTKKTDLEKLGKDLSSKEPYLNLLINNAGISSAKVEPSSESASELYDQLWTEESFEDWSNVMTTNVSAVYFSTIAFLPLLQAAIEPSGPFPRRSPSVIVISSMSGIMRQSQGHFAYNAAKAATVHLTKLMSTEFEKASIRVNSIAPGYFPSELTMKDKNEDNKTHMPAEKVLNKGHEVPAQRPGSDEEMAQAVIFLTKNMYVNGEVLAVDGGSLHRCRKVE
ncbi:uncharacterized protein KY384_006908 [Bacidia gigantensis]|uniref:uncharacterized protein n=1 Tax=Bacidia gigantensis TaxID=2732470 RepID=UPI001D039F07|nr:uncharacterized protein KY384_006908 [Bacidia gigantensis]KAG8527992.1 hypothetical protein KY384_006908 [Bacidia gigantensis]